MDFLRRCVTFWHASTQPPSSSDSSVQSPAEAPYEDGPISDTERLSRFISDEDSFTLSTGRIDFREFLPPKKGPHTEEVSVMRTEGLADDAVWAIGDRVVAERSGRPIRARGDFTAPAVRASRAETWQLTVRPDAPPPRHALVVGWPPAADHQRRKNLAKQLRAEATLVVR
jgi:hypothetical protein